MSTLPFSLKVYTENIEFEKSGDFYVNTSKKDEYDLQVSVKTEHFDGCGAVRQITTVKNNGSRNVVLTYFSSAHMQTAHGVVAVDGNRWQAEGQWNYFTFAQCGLVPSTRHEGERLKKYRIDSVGTWSTSSYYPLTMVIGDDGFTYFMELECGAVNWSLTHIATGGIITPKFYLEGSCADEQSGGWSYTLKPGESYTTLPAIYGKVKGGFEEAIAELLVYRRKSSLATVKSDTVPIVFNDYMNCLWARPTDKKLLPLIDAAADIGCEYFCIDAGWHKNAGKDGAESASRNGDWIINDELFGSLGLSGIFEYMKKKGLKPGLWFELDNVNSNAAAYGLDDDCVLRFCGRKFDYSFFNFKNQRVRKHLHSRIDELYALGMRYIKNDYNETTGMGCDDGELSHAEGLIRNYEAFLSFIDEVRQKHPDLIIENCGSGALRSDNGTLKHFALQSTSDQEIYYFYPSIITGTSAQYAPEKAGIWSYPCPVLYAEKENPVFDGKYYEKIADGEETVFNMINGMCGALYQSGRIDKADEKNLSLIKEGIAVYKKMRTDIPTAHPILPTGTFLIGENGFASFGLESYDKKRAYLAVWRIGATDDTVKINLSKYGYTKASPWYPNTLDFDFSYNDGFLTLKLPKEYSARMLLLEK